MPLGPKRPRDPNQAAKLVLDIATGEVQDTLSTAKAASNGRVKGVAGGQARARRLTKDERTDIARIAAAARWKKG